LIFKLILILSINKFIGCFSVIAQSCPTITGPSVIEINSEGNSYPASGGSGTGYQYSSPSGLIYIEPTSGQVDAFDIPSTYVGQVEIDVVDSQGNPGKKNITVSQINFQGFQSLNYLWYFEGQKPEFYPVIQTGTASIFPPDLTVNHNQWGWTPYGCFQVNAHSDSSASSVATIQSTGKSGEQDDCDILATATVGSDNASISEDTTFTVDYVANATMGPENTFEPPGVTWVTQTPFACNSKFGSNMTNGIELNENWVANTYAQYFKPCDWVQVPQGNPTSQYAANYMLDIVTPTDNAKTPPPSKANLGPLVDSWKGYWMVGSLTAGQGTTAFTATWNRNTTSAFHTNVAP